MDREILSIKRKALRINLDKSIYGTFAEIGAGQEVARTFFQVGGASGTIAKTMSAYDMTFSDAIYGEESSGRYVSESRLKKMLNHEFELMQERLTSEKYKEDRFFCFADTCTTINFLKNNDPHCWMGLKFQTKPGGAINEIVMHIRLKENDALLQQRTIGAFGVNLIFACYFYNDNIDFLLDSLFDNLSADQAEIDMLRIKGDDFEIDNRLIALKLVKKNFTSGTIFGPDKEVYQPKDILYKKNVVCLRGRFRPVTKVSEDMYQCGLALFKKMHNCEKEDIIGLSEITLNNLEMDAGHSDKDFIDRTEILCNLGHTVLISNSHKHDKLISYLKRCKPHSIGIIIGMMNLIDLFNPEKYENVTRELLEYFGDVFSANTQMLVYPYKKDAESLLLNTSNFDVPANIRPLLNYLVENKFIIDIENFDESILSIFSNNVISKIKSGESGWEDCVPDTVAQFIKDNCLFDYPCAIK